jgi:DNA-binding CsgD family transcriptional regulator
MLHILAGLGGLAGERRQFERAARLLGVVAALADAVGVPLQPAEQTQFDSDVAAIRAALSDATFSEEWEAGRSLPLEAAVAEALEGADPALSANPFQSPGLSDRELDVLRLLAKGMSDREISEALFISRGTATTHVKNIRTKLGVHSRGAAVAYAVRHGLV